MAAQRRKPKRIAALPFRDSRSSTSRGIREMYGSLPEVEPTEESERARRAMSRAWKKWGTQKTINERYRGDKPGGKPLFVPEKRGPYRRVI